MDLNEALTIFIKSNLRILVEDPFPENYYKQIKKEFFGDFLKNKFGRPRDSRIADTAVDYMVRYNIINDMETYNKIIKTPFIDKRLSEKNKIVYLEKIGLKRKSISLLDPEKLGRANNIEKIKSELKQELYEEEYEDIQDAILQKQKEYYSIPSVLDAGSFPEPDVELDVTEYMQLESYIPWWKKLSLSSDPFPGQGLENIKENVYDKIIYKTEIFETYQKYIDDYPEALYKNTIFFGQFGSGKSTLFEYLQYLLININIVPLYVVLYGEDDLRGMIITFKQKLLRELLLRCSNLNIPISVSDSINDSNIDYLMDSLIDHGQKGIIIFIDDLHKNPDVKPAMDFMNHIQSYSAELRRRRPSLKFSVFVAGSLEWKKELRAPRFSGSFSRFVDIPTIDKKIAYEAINMRLIAFSENPENPKKIHFDAIERAYEQILRLGRPNTFRSFIQYIVGEFEKNNFDILVFDPYISELEKKEIKDMFTNNRILKARLDFLIYGSSTMSPIKDKDNIRKCLEQLVRVYLRKEIPDNDEIVKEKGFEFNRLSNVGLISKLLKNDILYWTTCDELIELNSKVIKKYGLSIEDYFIPIFYGMDQRQSIYELGEESKYSQIFSKILNDLSADIKSIFFDSINVRNQLLKLFEKLENVSSLRKIEKRYQVRDMMINSLNGITKAVILYSSYIFEDIDNFFELYWYKTDDILEYYRCMKDQYKVESSIKDTASISYLYQMYKNAYDDIINHLDKQVTLSKLWDIPVKELNNEDILEFQKVRDYWCDNEYFYCVKIICEYSQKKLRNFLYNILYVLYGVRYEIRINKNVKKYISENMIKSEKRGFGESINYFDYINRHHYKDIVIEGPLGAQNWREIFQPIFNPLKKEEMKNYLEDLAYFATETDHLKTSSINTEHQNRILKFMIDSLFIIKKINSSYIMLLDKSYKDQVTNNVFMSLYDLIDKNNLTPIYVGENANTLFSRIESKKEFNKIPLDNPRYINNYFDVNYRVFYAFMSQMISLENEVLKIYDVKGSISIKKNQFESTSIDILYKEI